MVRLQLYIWCVTIHKYTCLFRLADCCSWKYKQPCLSNTIIKIYHCQHFLSSITVVPNWFWSRSHFGISKILMPPVIFNSYICKILPQLTWRILKRPLTWSLNMPYQNIITLHIRNYCSIEKSNTILNFKKLLSTLTHYFYFNYNEKQL